MIDPTKVDINQLPKRYCDGVLGSFNKEIFVVAFTSGNELTSFVTTPQIMKSIAQWLSGNIENYEKQFGVIDMAQPLIVSPIQSSDLSGSQNS